MQIHVQIPVHCAACVNIYSCSWSVEGGLEKVSQRGEGEILFIEELFSVGEQRRVDRFVTIHYVHSLLKIQMQYKFEYNDIQMHSKNYEITGVKIQNGRSHWT